MCSTDGGASVKGSPRRRPPPPPAGGYEGAALNRTASISQAASYTHTDAFQQPFNPDVEPEGQSSRTREAPHGLHSAFAETTFPESAFAKQQQPLPRGRAEDQGPSQPDSAFSELKQPEPAFSALKQLAGPAQGQEPEAVRKLREAGQQPLPHSAFTADHKSEPTSFAIPPAELTDQRSSSSKVQISMSFLCFPHQVDCLIFFFDSTCLQCTAQGRPLHRLLRQCMAELGS